MIDIVIRGETRVARPSPHKFFFGHPPEPDKMWCAEWASVCWHLSGRGLDPGAGLRTFSDDTWRMDLNAAHQPHVQGSAIALPFRDESFDYVASCHLIEHLPDPIAAIEEWLRVVRPGGHVAIICPDTRFTMGMNSDPTPHLYEWSPMDFQRDVLGWVQTEEPWFKRTGKTPVFRALATVLSFGEACRGWSFHVVLQRW